MGSYLLDEGKDGALNAAEMKRSRANEIRHGECQLTTRLEVYDAILSPGTRPHWSSAETASATSE